MSAWRLVVALAVVLILPSNGGAQDAGAAGHQHDHPANAANDPSTEVKSGWTWSESASAFFGFNYQHRKFTDFHAWESQNWIEGSAGHRAASGTVRLTTMISLEPFTLKKIGSPQVFQTGETYRGAPLIDYQHPHDLLMALGSEYVRQAGAVAVNLGLDVVGAATLGPEPFMHRASAESNPQAPLGHHYMDSTHVTPGVVRAGAGRRGWLVEGSWFHGREPDEDRTDIDLGALDSYALRLSWRSGPWAAQASGAALTQPEAITPYDAKRLTASLAYTGPPTARLAAWMAGFGQNREIHGNLEAYLFEAEIRASASARIYMRAESVAKDILDAGFHPRGVFHRHRQSQVGAFTVGYLRTMLQTTMGSFGVGGDLTGYAVPANLTVPYGSPVSLHLFVRYSRNLEAGHHSH